METPNGLFSAEDLQYVRERYQKRIAEDGVTFRSMNSGTEAKQRARHSIHSHIISKDARVLDLGCGIGLFYRFLLTHGYEGAYTGFDVVPEYVDYCGTHFPQARFEVRNIFELGVPDRYDVIIASQVFNVKYPKADNLAVLSTFLEIAYERADYAVSVDMLSAFVDFTEDHLYYYSPETIFAHAKTLSRAVRLHHEYLPFEFTIQLFR